MTTLDEARNKLALANRILADEGVRRLRPCQHAQSVGSRPLSVGALAKPGADRAVRTFSNSRWIRSHWSADRISLWRAGHPWLHLPGTAGRACRMPSSFARRDAVWYSGVPLQPVDHLGATMGAVIPFWDQRANSATTDLIVAKSEEGQSLARALGPNWVVLMRRHGATVAGISMEEMVFRSVFSCRNAEMQREAQARPGGILQQADTGRNRKGGCVQPRASPDRPRRVGILVDPAAEGRSRVIQRPVSGRFSLMSDTVRETPVLIAGGGPIGLALAADLGRRGVRRCWSRSAKQAQPGQDAGGQRPHDGVLPPARHRRQGAQLGISRRLVARQRVRDDLQGYELGRVRMPALGEQAHLPVSPERGMPCPQTWFDPILQEHRAVVSARDVAAPDQAGKLRAGPRRRNGDAARPGRRRRDRPLPISRRLRRFCEHSARAARHRDPRRAPYRLVDDDLSPYSRPAQQHDKGKAFRYVFVGPEGTWSFLSIVDGKDLWRLQLVDLDEGRCRTPIFLR